MQTFTAEPLFPIPAQITGAWQPAARAPHLRPCPAHRLLPLPQLPDISTAVRAPAHRHKGGTGQSALNHFISPWLHRFLSRTEAAERLFPRRTPSPTAADGRTRCPLCPLHGHRGTSSRLGPRSPGGGTATWCPRRGCCFLSNLRADFGHAEEATPPRGKLGLRRPPKPRAAAIPPALSPGISALTAPGAAPAERSRTRSTGRGNLLPPGHRSHRGPSTGSPQPPPPCGEAGRAPAVPPQPTPGRALTPRPSPASITSRSAFEPLPPAVAASPRPRSSPGVAALRLVLRSRGARQRCPSGPASARRDSPSPGQPLRASPGLQPPLPRLSLPAGWEGLSRWGLVNSRALQPEQPHSAPAAAVCPQGSSRGRRRFLRHLRPSGRPRTPAFPPWRLRCLPGDAEACAGSWVEGSHRLLFPFSPLFLGELLPRFSSPQEPQSRCLALPRPLLGLFLISAAPCPSTRRGHGFGGGLCAATERLAEGSDNILSHRGVIKCRKAKSPAQSDVERLRPRSEAAAGSNVDLPQQVKGAAAYCSQKHAGVNHKTYSPTFCPIGSEKHLFVSSPQPPAPFHTLGAVLGFSRRLMTLRRLQPCSGTRCPSVLGDRNVCVQWIIPGMCYFAQRVLAEAKRD